MQPRTFRALLAASCIPLVSASCGFKGPKVVVCVYSQPDEKFACVDKQGQAYELEISAPESDKLVCFPRGDAEKLLAWCQRGSK